MVPAGWVHWEQQAALEFRRIETQVLLELIGKKRILLNDDQQRRLADLSTIVKPDTILRWHRQLIAEKWDYSEGRRKKPECYD